MGYTSSIGLYVPDWTGFTITALLVGIILLGNAIFEFFREPAPYSKFGNRKIDTIPSKRAMLFIYVPSVFVCLLIQKPAFIHWNTQLDIAQALNMAHFLKRVFEVCFIHIYSGKANVEAVCVISAAYAITTLLDLLTVARLPENAFSSQLTKYGIVCFVVGELVNGYHHWLLRQMRLNRRVSHFNKGAYTLPRGGLFNFVINPHYAAEQLSFLGFILISQNVVSLAVKSFPFIYLTARAHKTYEWYSVHLTDKKDKADLLKRKKLIPFIW